MPSIGPQPDSSQQPGAVTGAPPPTQDTTNNLGSTTLLQTLLTELAQICDTSDSDTTPYDDNTNPTGSGLSGTQIVQGGSQDPSDQKGGQGGTGPEEKSTNESSPAQLVSPGALNTSSISNAAANIEKQSAKLTGLMSAENAKNPFFKTPTLNTGRLANTMSQLAPKFTQSATALGINSNDIANISFHLQNVTSSANTLNVLANAGASPNAQQAVMNTMNKELTLACAGIATAFANNTEALSNFIVQNMGGSKGDANIKAQNFANMINNYSSFGDFITGKPKSDDTTTTTDALDSESYQTVEMAVGGFAAQAASGLGLLDSYESFLYTTNASIGNDTATVSENTNKNTLQQINKEEKEQRQEEQASKLGSLLGKIFRPVQTLSAIVTPVIINFDATAISTVVNGVAGHQVVSKSEVASGLNKTTAKALQGDLSMVTKPITAADNFVTNSVVNEMVEGLAKIIPGMNQSLAKEILTPFVAAALDNPMLAFKSGQKLDDLVTNSVVSGMVEGLAKIFPGINTTLATEILTPFVAVALGNPIEAVQSFNKLLTVALVDLCMAINPNLNEDVVQMAVSESIIGAEMIAVDIGLCMCGGEEAAEEVDSMMMREAFSEGSAEGDAAMADATVAREMTEAEYTAAVTGTAVAASSAEGATSSAASKSSTESAEKSEAAVEQENQRLALSEEGDSGGGSAKAEGTSSSQPSPGENTSAGAQSNTNATTSSKDSSIQNAKEASNAKDTAAVGGEASLSAGGGGAGANLDALSAPEAGAPEDSSLDEGTDEREAITSIDGSREDARIASNAKDENEVITPSAAKTPNLFEKGLDTVLNNTPIARLMKAQSIFSAVGNMVQSGIQIWQEVILKEIANTQYQIALGEALQKNLDFSMQSTNANTSNTNTAINANITGISTGNSNVANSAATTQMEFPG